MHKKLGMQSGSSATRRVVAVCPAPRKSHYGRSDPEALAVCPIANLSDARNGFKQPKQATDNAEDFKQGAKIDKASVSRGGYMGSLLKIPLC